MSSQEDRPSAPASACAGCLRRGWLLAQLTGPLEFVARDRARLHALLALDDSELISAVAGSRRDELEASHERFHVDQMLPKEPVEAVCRHDPCYPASLRDAGGPRMLYVLGGVRRLAELSAGPVVAVAGSPRASDYGIEMSRSLARGLAAAGITVTSAISAGIALTAQMAALDAGGRTLAVTGSGLGLPSPARARAIHEAAAQRGCVVSELPCGVSGRMWGAAAGERTLARLARLTVMVEAGEGERELATARLAMSLGRTVAAVPGRVTSCLSAGTNGLLMDGAPMVRGPADVLELLYGDGAVRALAREEPRRDGRLTPRLRSTLERVGSGCDTPEKLSLAGVELEEALLALSELELMGLLGRGDGGRYIPRGALPPP